VVGDVNPKRVKKMAQLYFGRMPKTPKPEPVETVEPKQQGERIATVVAQAQPFTIVGYHRPDVNDPDNAVFDAITDILGAGRTSRLYKSLVKEKKIAIQASAFSGLTGDKYPGLFIFYAFPAKGHTNEENLKAIDAEIERLKSEPVTKEELEKAKTRARAGLIRQLNSNMGMAIQLTYFQVITGDWRNLFRQIDKIKEVTAEDIQRVANKYFTAENRTVGFLVTKSSEMKTAEKEASSE